MENGHNFHSLIMALKISNQNCDIQIPPLSSKPLSPCYIYDLQGHSSQEWCVYSEQEDSALPGGLHFAQTSQSPPIPERRDHLLVLCAWFILFR